MLVLFLPARPRSWRQSEARQALLTGVRLFSRSTHNRTPDLYALPLRSKTNAAHLLLWNAHAGGALWRCWPKGISTCGARHPQVYLLNKPSWTESDQSPTRRLPSWTRKRTPTRLNNSGVT